MKVAPDTIERSRIEKSDSEESLHQAARIFRDFSGSDSSQSFTDRNSAAKLPPNYIKLLRTVYDFAFDEQEIPEEQKS